MKKSKKVVSMPRGGFAVSGGRVTVSASDIKAAASAARRFSKKSARKGLVKTVKGLAVKGAKAGAAAAVSMLAEKAWTEINKELNQRLDARSNGRTLIDAPNDLTGGSSPVAAASVVNGVSKMQLANMSDDRVIHKTKYESGYPLTPKMKRLLKQNGATYKVLCDSKIEQKTFLGRNYLTQNSGFNLKRYHCPPTRAQLPYYLIRDLCMQNALGDLTPTYADSRVTSAVAKLKQQFLIKNQSVALPLELTIHLIKVTDRALTNVSDTTFQSFTDLFARCFTLPEPMPTSLAGRVPQWYVATDPVVEGSGVEKNFSVDCLSVMKSLDSSVIFRQGMEVVESFKKTLAPGDFWNFSHTHTTGNGIDMDILARTVNPFPGVTQPSTQVNSIVFQDNFPFTYGVVFEAKGKLGEIYYVPAVNQIDTYLGATPTAWSYEYKSSAYYVTDSYSTTTNPNALVPYQIENTSADSIRQASVQLGERPFFLPFTGIANATLDEALPASVGRGYIPTNTSTAPSSRVYEGSAPG